MCLFLPLSLGQFISCIFNLKKSLRALNHIYSSQSPQFVHLFINIYFWWSISCLLLQYQPVLFSLLVTYSSATFSFFSFLQLFWSLSASGSLSLLIAFLAFLPCVLIRVTFHPTGLCSNISFLTRFFKSPSKTISSCSFYSFFLHSDYFLHSTSVYEIIYIICLLV